MDKSTIFVTFNEKQVLKKDIKKSSHKVDWDQSQMTSVKKVQNVYVWQHVDFA